MAMSFMSMVEAELPPGFRFHPRDDELICEYLAPKVSGRVGFSGRRPPMVDVDLNKCEPWDLPDVARVGAKEWYFFSLRDRKYATGQRTNRATLTGYWKATGKDRAVGQAGTVVGMRKTLVFYQGRAPKGRKTEWVMHEYRMEKFNEPVRFPSQEDWVLCRVLCKKREAGAGAGATAISKPRAMAMAMATFEDDMSTTSSFSLPPLMETAMPTFTQTETLTLTQAQSLEQVPCFSSFTSSNTPYCYNSADHLVISPATTNLAYLQHDDMSDDLAAYLDPSSCDKKVIRAVLSHLSKSEGCDSHVGCFPAEMSVAGWNHL